MVINLNMHIDWAIEILTHAQTYMLMDINKIRVSFIWEQVFLLV